MNFFFLAIPLSFIIFVGFRCRLLNAELSSIVDRFTYSVWVCGILLRQYKFHVKE